jgi:glycosyltransferase involved in cell wall biosynthesis
MKKTKIILHSNHCRAKTGFGKHMKHLLCYLHKKKKYEVIEFANAKAWNDKSLSNMPWKAFGSLPIEQDLIQEINSDTQKARLASYGSYKIDDLIKQEKPDIYLGIEDIWGLEHNFNKKWWKSTNSIAWTPIDSLPLLDKHIEGAKSTKNIIVQASFAKQALEDKGFKNVHLMPVPVDTKNFYKLKEEERRQNRINNNINDDDFVIGFVFRNQLRKSIPNLLEGFKSLITEHKIKAKLLLHTHWSEGWDIPKLLQEKSIDPNLVLTTYYCDKCGKYEIKPFSGQDLDCKFCGSEKSQQTSQINRGVSEQQLNEIYNMMDVYCHAFTSGGQEIPIQEAKLTELITLVTSYSCGEDYCTEESGGLPLNWNEYREPGTQFIKASTCSKHITEQLLKVYNMSQNERKNIGKIARKFTIDFCSIESVCSKFEKLLESLPKIDFDFDFSYVKKDEQYVPPEIQDNRKWIIDLYNNILKCDAEKDDTDGIAHWENRLNSGTSRQDVYNYFIEVARSDNQKNITVPFESLLSEDDQDKRILFVMPGSQTDVFNSTSLLKYIKDKYPDYNIYFATDRNNFDILNGNPFVHKVLEFNPIMENFAWCEGQGDYNGMFQFVLMPHINTSKVVNYIHGNKHHIEYDLNYA